MARVQGLVLPENYNRTASQGEGVPGSLRFVNINGWKVEGRGARTDLGLGGF